MPTTQSNNQSTTGRASDSKMTERMADSIGSASVRLADAVEAKGSALADIVEEKGSALAESANRLISDASDKVRYVRESEPKKLGADLLSLIKRHPVVSLTIGIGLGLLLRRRRR